MTAMLETRLTLDDLDAFQRFQLTSRPVARESLKRLRLVYMSVLAFAGVVGFVAWHARPAAWFALAFLGAVGTWVWFQVPTSAIRGARQRAQRSYPLGMLPPTRLWLDETGLNTDSAGTRVHYDWSVIRQIDETPTHAFVWVGEIQAVIVARRAGDPRVGPFLEGLKASTVRMTFLQHGTGAIWA